MFDVGDSALLDEGRAPASERHTELAVGTGRGSGAQNDLRRAPPRSYSSVWAKVPPDLSDEEETVPLPPTSADGALIDDSALLDGAEPLDPKAFVPTPDEVESLLNEVIDEVERDRPVSASAEPAATPVSPASDLAADLVLEEPKRAPVRPPESDDGSFAQPLRFFFPTAQESRTDVTDAEAAAIDRAVSRSLETGMKAAPPPFGPPKPDAPAGTTGPKATPVILGRLDVGPPRPAGADSKPRSGPSLADELRASTSDQNLRGAPPAGPAGPGLEISLTTKILAVIAAIVMALVAASVMNGP